MFQNDVTKNYQLQDATLEILIMLAGAFLLGCLFCWALRKLRGEGEARQTIQQTTVDHQNAYRIPEQETNARRRESNLLKSAGASVSGAVSSTIIAKDTTTQTARHTVAATSSSVEYAGNQVANKGSGIKEDLSNNTSAAGETLSNVHSSLTESADIAGEKFSSTGSSLTGTISNTVGAIDNLKKIEGIGPKIETVLQAAGINSYASLRSADNDTLKAILEAAGPSFKMHDPETWPYQADLACNGQWDKLKEYQDFLMAD